MIRTSKKVRISPKTNINQGTYKQTNQQTIMNRNINRNLRTRISKGRILKVHLIY